MAATWYIIEKISATLRWLNTVTWMPLRISSAAMSACRSEKPKTQSGRSSRMRSIFALRAETNQRSGQIEIFAKRRLPGARRPRNTLNLAADWQTPLKPLALGVDFRLVSSAIDYNSAYNLAVGSIHNLPSYTLVTLHGSYDLTARVQLFARLENVGDTQYQTAYSYNSAGRSAYAGLRVKY